MNAHVACHTYLDLISNGYQPSGTAIILLTMGVGAGIVWLIALRWRVTRLFDQLLFRLSLPVAAVSALVMCWMNVSTSYADYTRLIGLYYAGLSRSVEGTIENYVPYGTVTPRADESFRVGTVIFSYNPLAPQASFHGNQAGGPAIRDGRYARVVYIEGQIIRLEVCPGRPS